MRYEHELLQKLKSKYILEYIEHFEDKKFLCIVTTLMDTNLQEYVEKHGCLSEEQAKFVFANLTNAIDFCHKNKVIHRDIKPGNVLLKLDKNSNIIDVILSDFGQSCPLDTYDDDKYYGTYYYMAPEIISLNTRYNEKVDLWSLGCVLFFCLTGDVPFNSTTNLYDLFVVITQFKLHISDKKLVSLPPDALDLIKGLL